MTADVAERDGLHIKKLSGTRFRQMLRGGERCRGAARLPVCPAPGAVNCAAALVMGSLLLVKRAPLLRWRANNLAPRPQGRTFRSGLPSRAWWRCCASTSSTRCRPSSRSARQKRHERIDGRGGCAWPPWACCEPRPLQKCLHI